MKKWIFLLMLLFGQISYGYQIASDVKQGMFWPSFPLAMQVVVPADDGGELLRLVQECAQEWEDSLGLNIWDIREARSGDKNTIYWENNFGQVTGYNPQQTLAVTFRYQQSGIFTRVQILLNGEIAVLRQNWNGLLRKTILHELGHTFGLDHSQLPAIMQAYIGNYAHIQDDDVQGANEVIDIQQQRQENGALFNLEDQQQKIVNCATVDLTSGNDGGGPLSFILSLLLGPLLLVLAKRKNFHLR